MTTTYTNRITKAVTNTFFKNLRSSNLIQFSEKSFKAMKKNKYWIAPDTIQCTGSMCVAKVALTNANIKKYSISDLLEYSDIADLCTYFLFFAILRFKATILLVTPTPKKSETAFLNF